MGQIPGTNEGLERGFCEHRGLPERLPCKAEGIGAVGRNITLHKLIFSASTSSLLHPHTPAAASSSLGRAVCRLKVLNLTKLCPRQTPSACAPISTWSWWQAPSQALFWNGFWEVHPAELLLLQPCRARRCCWESSCGCSRHSLPSVSSCSATVPCPSALLMLLETCSFLRAAQQGAETPPGVPRRVPAVQGDVLSCLWWVMGP